MGNSPRPSIVPVVEAVAEEEPVVEVPEVSVKRQVKTTGTFKIKALVSNVKEELQCPICLEEFVKPRLLHCGHSYCTGCLKSIYAHDIIKCPSCRYITRFNTDAPFQVQPRASTSMDMRQSYIITSSQNQVVGTVRPERHPVETLSLNYSILRVIDIIDGIQNQKKQVAHNALDDCIPTPLQVKLQPSKVDAAYQPSRAGQWQDHLLLCKHHKFEEVQFWCKTCSTLLCSSCLVSAGQKSSHVSHDLETLQSATQAQLKEVKESQDLIKSKLQVLSNLNAELDSNIRHTNESKKQLQLEIESIKQTWWNHINQWYGNQTEQLLKLEQQEVDKLTSQKQWIDQCQFYLSKGYTTVEQVLKEFDSEGVIKKRDIVKIWNEVFEVKERTQQWKDEVEASCEVSMPHVSFSLQPKTTALPDEINFLPHLQEVTKSVDT